MIRPATETASMIVENVTRYSLEKHHSFPLARFKMSDAAVRRISGHVRLLPESYLAQLVIELQQLDWIMVRWESSEFIFMHFDIPKNWTKLSAKRVVPNDEELEIEQDVSQA